MRITTDIKNAGNAAREFRTKAIGVSIGILGLGAAVAIAYEYPKLSDELGQKMEQQYKVHRP